MPPAPHNQQSSRNLLEQDDFSEGWWRDDWEEYADFDMSGGRREHERF
jgi:hypothetical protein